MQLVFGEAAGGVAVADSATTDARIDQLQAAVDDAMTELMQPRERVDGSVVPELQRQGELLAAALADLNNAGASKPEEEQAPEGEGTSRRALTTAVQTRSTASSAPVQPGAGALAAARVLAQPSKDLGVGPSHVVQLVEASDGSLGAVWATIVVGLDPAVKAAVRSVLEA